MSNIPTTSTFRAWHHPQKRPRTSLVCLQCRKSKLKCDRLKPCSSCVRRDGGGNCSYSRDGAVATATGDATVAVDGDVSGNRDGNETVDEDARGDTTVDRNRNTDRRVRGTGNIDGRESMEDRLAHLESLVRQLIGQQSEAGPSELPNPVPVGQMTPPAEQDSYVGFTHWSTILDEIQGLKESVTAAQETSLPPHSNATNTELLFGSAKDYSLDSIISELPPTEEVERILQAYFEGEVFILPLIHRYKFEREVAEFWKDPKNVDPLWLSILFSVCYTESIIRPATRPSGGPVKPGNLAYHTASAQCLVLGEHHRPQKHGLEALILYAHCKNFGSLDPSREAGAILGFVVRMAYEMGYHRDPDSFGKFSVFEGEMRRRLWATCKQLDLMMSFMLGLPSNICLENCDTKSPRNLLDSDFDVDTEVLPSCRSVNEITKLLWFTVKDRQMNNFGKVCRNALSFKDMSEAEVFELDKEIRDMYESIPVGLRARPVSESKMYGPFIIIVRLYIEFIHLKSVCVLHRRYIAQGRPFSTRACAEAGKSIVSQFIDMYDEFGPSGYLHNASWMLGNYTMNDFLLGVMVLCLILHHRSSGVFDAAGEQELITLLERSHEICLEKSELSRDARRVSYAIKLVLDDVKLPRGTPRMQVQEQGLDQIDQSVNPSFLSLEPHPSFLQESPFGLLDPFQFAGSDLEEIDWAAFDQDMANNN